MKKIIKLIFALIIISFLHTANGDFYDFTIGLGEFDKLQGSNSFYSYEDYYVNPFSDSTIVKQTVNCTGNLCTSPQTINYIVDGRTFNSSHPLYKSKWSTFKGENTDLNGIITKVVFLENTYTSNLVPRQRVKVRKYYTLNFNHDKTPPTCGSVKYYKDSEGRKLLNNTDLSSDWYNIPLYFTMTCVDAETGCNVDNENTFRKKSLVISKPEPAGHLSIPNITYFKNNVDLKINSCEPSGDIDSYKVKYDDNFIDLSLELNDKNFDLSDNNNRLYLNNEDSNSNDGELEFNFDKEFNFKAIENNTINLKLTDIFYSDDSTSGVSGIKEYSFDLYRLTRRNFQNITNETKIDSCSLTKTIEDQYNANGTKDSSDIIDESIECNELKKSGKYKVVLTATDFAGNKIIGNIFINIYPSDISISKSNLSVYSIGDKYGNNKDEYIYTLELKDKFGNPIFSKDEFERKITNLKQSIDNYNGGKTIYLDNVSNNGYPFVFSFDNYSTNNDGKIIFKLKSYSPGTFTQRFSFEIKKWGDDYKNISGNNPYTILIEGVNNENTFKKPISINEIKVSNDGGNNWEGVPEIGKDQKYKIVLNNDGDIANFENGKLNNLETNNSIITSSNYHSFIDSKEYNKTFEGFNYYLGFVSRIEVTDDSGVLEGAGLKTKDLQISYKIDDKYIKYLLDDGGEIQGCDRETLGLKVEGGIQGDGKSDITGQEENYSDLSKGEIRSEIRKNAIKLISGLTPEKQTGKIYYSKSNINYSSISGLDFETLIIEDGNLIIDQDITRNIGIILLSDNYNILNDYNISGNIYVNNNVENINAYIYADGTFRSADSNGNSYNDIELSENLLVLDGSLFTRNTIGGAVKASSGKYLLPGGQETDNFELAEIYDLNYVRKTKICNQDYSFLIRYNPQIQVNPPVGFDM